ncbi:response regulator [Oscillatoria sp. FACHB-1407]|uniref:ATP-binding response regulator n=1 Tax=Oscillatoria sp. FACHB-1407 TaxID=2692847 RepID=UPI0016872C44|nr:ATP-binding protein [Oscillatoria sp. FACHB-1407]MBD2461740.1 response regulator [Oscillatoria sp. FACHB-1407]
MYDLFNLFFSEAFIPHGHCYLWKPSLVWLHLLSDSFIGLAYYSIPLTLSYFVRRRQDLPFNWIFLLFAAFIVACGTTHLMEVWTLWHPVYWFSGAIKVFTAIVSVFTAVQLIPLVPKALALPSPAQLEQANRELKLYQNQLEDLVAARTAELVAANQQLQQEISDRKQAELERERLLAQLQEANALLDTLFNNAPIGIGLWDERSRYVRLNQALADINGLPQDVHIGKTVAELLPTVSANVTEAFRHVLTTGESLLNQEAMGETPAMPGKQRFWLVSYYPIRLPRNITWVGAVCEEITERKRAEAEREDLLVRERAAREEAEAANRTKDEFLAVLSHELRSPLNPILGWAQLLRTRKFDEVGTARALETIERNARLQTQLIEDLLDVSRILRGKMVLNVEPVSLVLPIEAALETVQLAAEAKNIQIDTHLDHQIKPIAGDSNRLQQIVWNLLSNAIKFTPEGGRVEVKLESVESLDITQSDGSTQNSTSKLQPLYNYAQIQVSDTGQGINPAFLPRVFDYFRQADGSTTRKFGGLGLGLAIVRHLVELHGGTVHAASPGEGMGATFTVKLPLMTNVPQSTLNSEPISSTIDLSDVQVLVVDDEADMRDLMTTVLQEYGAKTQVATSATEAIALITQSKPDILLSDIGMPGEDGYMLVRKLRQMSPEQGGTIPAIALTAYAGEINRQKALLAGFQLHVPKPIEPTELVKAIASLVGSQP